MEFDSQKRKRCDRTEPIRPCRFEARIVSPKSMPSKMRKKIYKIKFRSSSSMAFGSQ